MSSSSERRRLQNRISQRNRRTRIRNHIAHLEAQVAATGGMAIGSCEANKGTFETSNGSIDTDSESYDPILDRLDSIDPVLSQDFQDSTLDDFEAFMNHSPDNAIDHNLTDIFQSSTDRSSPILSNEYPPKKNAMLPTPTSEGMMPDCLGHSNAAEAARRNDHDNDQQLDLDSDFTHHACNCAEKSLGSTVRKRKWPSRIHNSTRSSPSIAVSGDATPPKQYQKLSQHTQHDQSNRDSASLIPSSCCEHHENHRSCTAKRTMQNSKKAIENPTKASSCVSERAGLPIPYPSPAENGHHDYHLSQAREVSKSHYNPPTHGYSSPTGHRPLIERSQTQVKRAYCPNCACQGSELDPEKFVTIRIPKEFLYLTSTGNHQGTHK